MKKLILQGLILIMTINVTISQTDSINYNQYVFPEYEFRTLGFEGSFSRSRSNENNFDENNFDLNSDLDVSIYNYTNHRDKQIESIYNFGTYNEWDKTKTDTLGGYSQSYKNSINLDISNSNRRYKDNLKFTEFAIQTKINPTFRLSEENKSTDLDASSYMGIGIGKGRIDPLFYMFTIQFMVDELVNNKILLRALDQTEIFDLADQLTALSNTRILDARVRRKYIINNLANYILTNMPIDKTRIVELTTTVTDNITVVPISDRFLGKRFSIGLGLSYSYNNFDDRETDFVSPVFRLNYISYKQLSKKIQFKRSFDYFSKYQTSTLRENFEENLNTIIRLEMGILYNPNTRTKIEMLTNLVADAEIIEKLNNSKAVLNLRATLNIEYFLNYNTILKLSHYNSSSSILTDKAGFYSSSNFGIVHNIY